MYKAPGYAQGKTGGAGSVCNIFDIKKKSEPVPDWEVVRIFCLYQRHYILSSCPRFCLAHNRGLCIFDETILFRYNHSINQKEECIWKFSTFALEITIFQT